MESYHHGNDVSGTPETEAGPSSTEQCSNEQCANSLDDAVGKLLQGSLSSRRRRPTIRRLPLSEFYRFFLSPILLVTPISPRLFFPARRSNVVGWKDKRRIPTYLFAYISHGTQITRDIKWIKSMQRETQRDSSFFFFFSLPIVWRTNIRASP